MPIDALGLCGRPKLDACRRHQLRYRLILSHLGCGFSINPHQMTDDNDISTATSGDSRFYTPRFSPYYRFHGGSARRSGCGGEVSVGYWDARQKLMLDQILPSGGATLLRNGSPIFTTLAGVVERIPFDHPLEISEIISGQPTILVDRDIAMAWTPYEFLIDNVIDHVGTDIWSFVKQDGKWLISGVADNSRKPAE
ncbi:hypothetical protein DFH09DRAFT_1287817 [Mycena vulgaris]|nr:hypothetical protein DFH09DRAFT_1287817 [Mycena vulgaris]